MASRKFARHKELSGYQRKHYSVANISTEVLRMETGLPNKEVFYIIVNYVAWFKGHINYYSWWKAEAIVVEDQAFTTLTTMKQNYSNLHVVNTVLTFVQVLHSPLVKDIMTTIPSWMRNKLFSTSSFLQYRTDLEIATPKLMSEQSATYSTYRRMTFFKEIIGVALNAVITYISGLYPG